MIAWFLSPLGRNIAIAALTVAALWFVVSTLEQRGEDRATAKIERNNANALDKSLDARRDVERDVDAGRLRTDDGFRRD